MRTIDHTKIYHHFKGHDYRIICLAKDSDTLEEVVVYQNVLTNEVWVRKKDEFLSLVDKEKYPHVKQKYRFE